MISVCIATFNGENFLSEQIDSILPQLSVEDEIIISDDGSQDQTLAIIKKYVQKDPRIKMIAGPRKGIIANFSNAIRHSKGDIIFLADQDDIWLESKVQRVCAYFQSYDSVDVVLTDLTIVNERLEIIEPSYFEYRNVRTGFVKNIIKNSFIGAGMAFRSSLKSKILPIPLNVPMHDMWIGLLGNAALISETLTLYRRHDQNASAIKTKAKRMQQLKWRANLTFELVKRLYFDK